MKGLKNSYTYWVATYDSDLQFRAPKINLLPFSISDFGLRGSLTLAPGSNPKQNIFLFKCSHDLMVFGDTFGVEMRIRY